MTPAITVDGRAWGDVRWILLGALRKEHPHALIGRVAFLWGLVAKRFDAKRPSFVLDPAEIERALGAGSVEALIKARLAEAQLGGIYLKGTRERLERLAQARASGARGGARTAAKRAARGANEP